MKCTYRKLQESITDNTFPVLEIVEEKEYCYKNSSTQYIDISDIYGTLCYNQIKVEAVVKFTELDFDTLQYEVFTTRAGYHVIGTSRTDALAQIDVSQNKNRTSVSANTDVEIILDSANNLTYIDNVSISGSGTVSSSKIITDLSAAQSKLFGMGSKTAYVYLKSLKITDQTNDAVIAEFVPATVNGVGCVYNKVTGKAYYPSDGTLGIV